MYYRGNGKTWKLLQNIVVMLENGKEHETTVYWGFIGIIENMQTTTVYWSYIGIMEKKMETTTVHWGRKGI